MGENKSGKLFQNLLVTGGAGFIGANFIHYVFEKTGFEGRIINLDKLTYAGHPGSLSEIQQKFPDRYVFVQGDIADQVLVSGIFQEFSIDSVCHFAAESHVDRSIVSPDDFIQTNIIGTFRLLEAARRQEGFLRFHHISTDEVFGSLGETGYFREDTPYSPNSPYSASKASSDHLVRAYAETYNLPVSVTNCSNNYGPYQFPEKLIPLIILNALDYKPLPVYGDGRNVRDWLFVTDHCQAIWLVMTEALEGETYNVGGNCERENIELVRTICELIDDIAGRKQKRARRELITFVKDRPGHDRRYAIDATKIQKDLGWTPETSIESGLEMTIRWYLEHETWVREVQTGEYRSWIERNYHHRED